MKISANFIFRQRMRKKTLQISQFIANHFSTVLQNEKYFPITIIGGGIVGKCAALLLGRYIMIIYVWLKFNFIIIMMISEAEDA